MFPINRVFLILLIVLLLLPIGSVAFAQGGEDPVSAAPPANIVDFFSAASLPFLLGVVGSVVQTWLKKFFPNITTLWNVVLVAVFSGIAVIVVLAVDGLVPDDILTRYNNVYLGVLALLSAVFGSQWWYQRTNSL